MSDCQTVGALAALIAFFLSGVIAPIDIDRWWTLWRWLGVILLMLGGVVVLTAELCGAELW